MRPNYLKDSGYLEPVDVIPQVLAVRRFVFWQNFPNHLQAGFLRALASVPQCQVTLVTQEEIPKWRQDIGWSVPDFGNTRLYAQPDSETINRLLTEASSSTVHVFSGTRAYPMVWSAFLRCLNTSHVGVLSEPVSWHGLKGKLSLVRSRIDALHYQSRINFILAIGHMSREWFRRSGYPDGRVYPFGYFVDGPTASSIRLRNSAEHNKSKVNLSFIGQCIQRKGLDILLEALGGLKHLDWQLQIIGDGTDKKLFETLSLKLGLGERVVFTGARKNEEAMHILASSDLFVLPSRWDGWGAVVNEALMRGVPVVCSDRCGASDLLRHDLVGAVFQANCISNLRVVLAGRIAEGPRTVERTQRIKEWSKRIECDAAADYFLDVVDASINSKPKPTPQWL